MTSYDAEMLTRARWEPIRSKMVDWLIQERRFNPKGASRAIESFIETMAFVARETGVPQMGQTK